MVFLGSLFSGLVTILTGLFSAIFGGVFFKTLIFSFVTFGLYKLLAVVGLGFVTYTLGTELIDFLIVNLVSGLNTLGGQYGYILGFLDALYFNPIMSNLLTAYATAYAISSVKMTNTLVKKPVV